MKPLFPFICKTRAEDVPSVRNARMTDTRAVLDKLDALRAELVDLAFTLEMKGRLDAADLAISTSARVGELYDEFAAPSATMERSG